MAGESARIIRIEPPFYFVIFLNFLHSMFKKGLRIYPYIAEIRGTYGWALRVFDLSNLQNNMYGNLIKKSF